MNINRYLIKNGSDIDPMHDSDADEIRVEDNCLIITYNDLDKGVLDLEGNPCKHKYWGIAINLDATNVTYVWE